MLPFSELTSVCWLRLLFGVTGGEITIPSTSIPVSKALTPKGISSPLSEMICRLSRTLSRCAFCASASFAYFATCRLPSINLTTPNASTHTCGKHVNLRGADAGSNEKAEYHCRCQNLRQGDKRVSIPSARSGRSGPTNSIFCHSSMASQKFPMVSSLSRYSYQAFWA